MYSPSGPLKMSLKLCQQDGLYYSRTDTVTVDTNPRSSYSPFAGSVFTDVMPNVHLIDDNNDSVHSADSNLYDTMNVSPNTVNMDTDNHLTGPPPHLPGTMPTESTPCAAPITAPPIPRSRIHSRPTNPARQLESELWAAWLGHCGEDQLIALATKADGLPNSFEFHPFRHIDWKVQAWIHKHAARRQARKVDQAGARFYMDFGFIRASSDNYQRPNPHSDPVVDSYDGYSSYLLIMDNKLSMTWIFPTRSKSPPLKIIRLFLRTFGGDRNVGGFIRCNQGGELARLHTLVDMALTEFGYKVEPTGANSPSQNGQAEKWNNTFAVTTRALLYGASLVPKYWSAALLHAVYLHNRRVHSHTGVTPFEGWWGVKPNLKYLKLFGVQVCMKRTGARRSKLDRHDFRGLFLGYTSTDQNIRYLDLDSRITKTCHHATFDEAWYLQDTRPPAAELLYQLGLEYNTVSTTCPPPRPIDVANYPPPSPLTYILPDTAQARMRNLPLQLLPAPCSSGVAIHSISWSPHSGTCLDPAANDTSLSLSYNTTANDVAQIYLSPTPYNDAFEEILDLRKFNVSCHQAAGLTFLHQDGQLVLASMAPSTPGARVPCWRTRLHGAWLLSINGMPVHTLADTHQVFQDLYLTHAASCTLLFAHPKISHGLSNKGLPLLRRDHIPQLNIDQLSNQWAPQFQTPLLFPTTPTYEVVINGDVWNVVTKVMKLIRGKLLKQDDWADWNESEHSQLDQYDKEYMFGDPVAAEDKSAIFHLVWTYVVKELDGRKKV